MRDEINKIAGLADWSLTSIGKSGAIDKLESLILEKQKEARVEELKELEDHSESISSDRIDMVGMHIILDRIKQLEEKK